MSPLSVLVVDDEPLARRRLQRMLEALPGVQIAGQAGDVAEAASQVRALQPQLLLLDIQMPGGDGFALLDALDGAAPPEVVFVTAFDHHAVKAFETHAVDYLLKPVEPGRLQLAVERARRALELRGARERSLALEETVANLRSALRQQAPAQPDFWVRGPRGYERVPMHEVLHIQAERDYVRVHTAGRSVLHCESMASLAERLPPGQFIRVHRSRIVRRDRIVQVRRTAMSGLRVVLSDQSEFPVGRTYQARLLAALGR